MMIFSRELFDWDYEYKESFRMLRDGPSLVLPIISNANKVMYLDKTFYYWRIQNTESASKRYDVKSFFYSVNVLHKQIIYYSQNWKYSTKETEKLVSANYITDICIAAIKIRNLQGKRRDRIKLLSMIANEPMFREEYSLKYLDNFRKPIAYMLYHKQFWFIDVLSYWVGFIKRV